MSTEMVVGLITALTGTGIGAVAVRAGVQLWSWIDKRIVDCEKDRAALYQKVDGLKDEMLEKVETLKNEMITVSKVIGRMEEHLEYIDQRREDDHRPKM